MPNTFTPNRGPGRPKGSGIDDNATLARVADLLIAEPGLKPMTAMKRIVGRPDDALLHRLNRKFREREAALRDAARARVEKRRREQWLGFAKAATRAFSDTFCGTNARSRQAGVFPGIG